MERNNDYKTTNQSDKQTREEVESGGSVMQPRGNIYETPYDLDLESSVLGAAILERNIFLLLAEIVKVETFYSERHRDIYRAITTLINSSEPVDVRTVVNQLRKDGKLEQVGGAYYVASLTTQIANSANVEYYARVLVELSMRREIIATSIAIQKEAYDNTKDIFDVLDHAEKSIFEITNSNVRTKYEGMDSLLFDALKQIEENKNRKNGLSGVPSGFTELDKLTSGWQKSDLVIVAARPGMGKTAFMMSALRNAAVDHNVPVAIFSLEMASIQLVNRLISSEAEIDNESIKRGALTQYEWDKLLKKTSNLSRAPIFIDDTPALSIFEFKAKCRRLKSKYDIQLIVVDYLQLMCGDLSKKSSSREQEIASISRTLKNVAKELNVPIIALSQLSRAVEARGGTKKPQLSDLRESGSIEQDADMVIMLYRPDYYGITEDENGEPTNGKSEVIIGKHRNGSLGTVILRYVNQYTKFINYVHSDNFNNNDDDCETIQYSKMNDF